MAKDEFGNDVDDWRRDNAQYGSTPETSDDELRRAVGMAFVEAGGIDTWKFHIQVTKGAVRIWGTVAADQKPRIIAAAKATKGVKRVDDELKTS
jgi:osmotically-inducible protein OsmY